VRTYHSNTYATYSRALTCSTTIMLVPLLIGLAAVTELLAPTCPANTFLLLLLRQDGVMWSLLFVCLSVRLSVCLSFYEQDNSQMHLRMSTKHGRHGHGMTLWKWLHFGVDPDPDVDVGLVFTSLTAGYSYRAFYTIYAQSTDYIFYLPKNK